MKIFARVKYGRRPGKGDLTMKAEKGVGDSRQTGGEKVFRLNGKNQD